MWFVSLTLSRQFESDSIQRTGAIQKSTGGALDAVYTVTSSRASRPDGRGDNDDVFDLDD